ncbi:ankyrin repeat protein, variant [Blastomyces gilchristii SLH14081]|uniref:Ankyrin repeat protein n=3 Tax=Blastomyces TaxID=229219 RepID=A0A179UGJ2_BLAGS|nr:ankyrin repeat protein [Blastomyces gilchristii SLH14081]XP_031576809.1 ankyrin repeat protein, variant [Blastomyces gilchristii SLH14081]EQL38526.1 hypothetical protein BDFG_00112 [Blastomyces dermatitidis ATCC 26199]OAT05622.1 ankyrin repeat protein [Blastomyces gilchristii SLH14081]OAT05623.1 ankyrin repeat protein, variant [Blastomyces gilchristii SLH14081]
MMLLLTVVLPAGAIWRKQLQGSPEHVTLWCCSRFYFVYALLNPKLFFLAKSTECICIQSAYLVNPYSIKLAFRNEPFVWWLTRADPFHHRSSMLSALMESNWNTLPHEIQVLILSKLLPTFCNGLFESLKGISQYLLVCRLWNVEIGRLLVKYHSAECLLSSATESIALKSIQCQIAEWQSTNKDDEHVNRAVDSRFEFTYGLHKLLGVAIVRGYMSCINVLLENGAHQHGSKLVMSTVYHYAVTSGKPNRAEMLQLLNAHFLGGLDEEDDEDLMTPLAQAIFSNDLISVEQLILLGARVSQAIIRDFRKGAFAYAIDSNNITLLKLLLASGEDPDEEDANSHSSPSKLALALSNDNEDIIELLLDSGSPVNTPERVVQPLAVAVECCSLDRIKDLIDRGAKVNYADRSGRTPLSRAVSCRDLPIIQLLFDHGAEITPEACQEAPQRGCPHVATLLLEHLAREERTLKIQLGWHPPFSIGVKGAMELLLKAGADRSVLRNIQRPQYDGI